METLSVNTAIIGILAVGTRIAEALWDLDANPGDEAALLDLAVQEVKQCRSSIKLLHKTLCLAEAGQLPYPERAAWIQADHIVGILTDMAMALSDLQITCEMHMQGSEVQTTIQNPAAVAYSIGGNQIQNHESVREQCVETIRALCSRIRWHNLSIAMLMTVLKCKADADAENSCRGLEQRMTRLLSSNADLSGRMSTLDDVYGAKPTAGAPPPNPYHIASASAPVSPVSISSPTPLTFSASSADFYGSATGVVGLRRPASSPRSWSTYTGYTLADLPHPSAVALPLTTYELRHGTVFYTVAYARQASQDSGDSLAEQASQLPLGQRSMVKSATTESIAVPRNGSSTEKAADWSKFASKMKRFSLKRRDKKQAA